MNPKPELNSEQQRIYDSVPADEPRSKLESHRDLILLWKRQRRSYRRIRSLLRERCGIAVSIATLHGFVQRRNRPRKPEPELEALEPRTVLPLQPVSAVIPAATKNSQLSATADPYAEARERMRKHKEAPVAATPLKVFHVSEEDLDGTKPLRMIPPNPQKENR